MSTQVAIIEMPSELARVISESKISDLTKAERIASAYAPLMDKVSEQMQVLKTLVRGNEEHVEKAKRIRLDLGKIASEAESLKKSDKESLLLDTRFIDALFNTVNGAARITQAEAQEIENHFIEQERARLAALESERIVMLQKFTEVVPQGLSTMDENVFLNYLKGLEVAYNVRIEAERIAEEERIAKAKAEAEERERIRIENELLKAEREAREKEIEAEREAREKEIEAERLRVEKERKAAEAKAKKEREAAEAKLKAERVAREKVEAELLAKRQAEERAIKEAKAKADAELKAKALAEKKAKAAPDKAKLLSFAQLIDTIQTPDVKSYEAKEIVRGAIVALKNLSKFIRENTKEL